MKNGHALHVYFGEGKGKTSNLAPISIPRVGSSRRKISVSRSIHLAITIFCWFPPESFFTFCHSE